MNEHRRRAAALRLHAIASALALWGGSAGAVEIDTGNPDLKMRWDNTFRYNLGVRTDAQDTRIISNRSYDEGDAKFGKGKIVTNRFDLLSEFDVNYAGQFGARLAAAGWYDQAYDKHGLTSRAPGGFATPRHCGARSGRSERRAASSSWPRRRSRSRAGGRRPGGRCSRACRWGA